MSNRLIERNQTHITADGKDYNIITNYRNSLEAWNLLERINLGKLEPLAGSYAVVECMFGIDSIENEMSLHELNEAVKGIIEYLSKYARISEKEKKDKVKPLIDLEQDAQLIYDAFMSMGIDLETQDISYPRFMSLLRELPENCRINRIVYLRQLIRDGKINKKEYKSEKNEIERIGHDIIYINDKRKKDDDNFKW